MVTKQYAHENRALKYMNGSREKYKIRRRIGEPGSPATAGSSVQFPSGSEATGRARREADGHGRAAGRGDGRPWPPCEPGGATGSAARR